MPENDKEEKLNAMLERMGVSKQDRQIAADLSKHAAQKALDSISTVADTIHDPRMVNVVLISACLMVGQSAEQAIDERTKVALSRMPPEVRAMFEEIMETKVEAKPQGVRDFDGNYR